MNIIVFGAGAIGSLFGGLLSKKNTVLLVGRPFHTEAINKHGLTIKGKTRLHTRISAMDPADTSLWTADLLILTVKAYDTETAIKQACRFITKKTLVLSLQNGLDNISIIERYVNKKQIIAGVTTHGVIFSKPGEIQHTGKGITILGELDGSITDRIKQVAMLFNEANIKTTISNNILQDLWVKTIINSSINPLTAFFSCNNGYLLENPLLEKIVEQICVESTRIASNEGVPVLYLEMIEKTKIVIRETSNNESSMFQSVKNRKKTEIDAINGALVKLGKKHGLDVPLNEIMVFLIESLEYQELK